MLDCMAPGLLLFYHMLCFSQSFCNSHTVQLHSAQFGKAKQGDTTEGKMGILFLARDLVDGFGETLDVAGGDACNRYSTVFGGINGVLMQVSLGVLVVDIVSRARRSV